MLANKPSNLIIGCQTHYFAKLASTNEYAIQLLRNERVVEGTVIVTDDQYAGQGQMGNRWLASKGANITCSIILYPVTLLPENSYLLNKAMSAGIHQFLTSVMQDSVHIKWPNDMLVDGQKIAGLLIQNSIMGKQIQHSIVGIGVNVNETNLDQSLRATSLRQLTGCSSDVKKLHTSLNGFLNEWYQRILEKKWSEINQYYYDHLLGFRKNMRYKDLTTGHSFDGSIEEISPTGIATIRVDQQEVRQYSLKQIQLIV